MSHFTEPSASSTSAPLPIPDPIYGYSSPRPRTSAARFISDSYVSLSSATAGRGPVICELFARSSPTIVSIAPLTAGLDRNCAPTVPWPDWPACFLGPGWDPGPAAGLEVVWDMNLTFPDR